MNASPKILIIDDDGQVMTAEQITRAKIPYSQGEKWFTGEVPGMSLGIPLVSTLVWQTGGQVRITNRDGQAGVCVSLTLPVLTMERQET
jgi:two-component system, cell cycle response regulator